MRSDEFTSEEDIIKNLLPFETDKPVRIGGVPAYSNNAGSFICGDESNVLVFGTTGSGQLKRLSHCYSPRKTFWWLILRVKFIHIAKVISRATQNTILTFAIR